MTLKEKTNKSNHLKNENTLEEIVIVSVDPGNKSGVSVVTHEGVVYSRTINARPLVHYREMHQLLKEIRDKYVYPGSNKTLYFVSEDQFLGGSKPSRFSSSASVSENAIVWELFATILSTYRVLDRVYPNQWRATFGLASPKIKDKEKVALKICKERIPCFKDQRQSVHSAESALLGLHTLLTMIDDTVIPQHLSWVYLEKEKRKSVRDKRTKTNNGKKGRGKRSSSTS